MVTPLNAYTNFLAISDVLEDNDLYEVRTDYNAQGQILYIGKNITPNASTALQNWYVKKLLYDINGNLERVQLPDNGLGFRYSWDLRSTYFS